MNWYQITGEFHKRTFSHDGQLTSLSEDWQRELAALWRLEADVNNGAYPQFLSNWGRESYVYATQALKKMGASKMAEIVDSCQALIDEHYDELSHDPMQFSRGTIISPDGETIKEPGSVMPDAVVDRIYDLSYEFMNYPDNIRELGLRYYGQYLQNQADA